MTIYHVKIVGFSEASGC